MSANAELRVIPEGKMLRGFSNLYRKECRAWWSTRRWWINAILWPIILCGLLANMLFVPTIANLATEADIARAGSVDAHIIRLGLSVFFEFGVTALAIGAVILFQGLIINEKQTGVAEWLLSKPISRRAYLLAKLSANTIPVLILAISLPSLVAFGMLSIRAGALYPVWDFLGGVGIMVLNTLFYLSLTLMLGIMFNNRGPILGIALGSILGGSMVASMIKPLLHITPFTLPKLASLLASGMAIPSEVGIFPIISTAVWCLVFVLLALARLKIIEF